MKDRQENTTRISGRFPEWGALVALGLALRLLAAVNNIHMIFPAYKTECTCELHVTAAAVHPHLTVVRPRVDFMLS